MELGFPPIFDKLISGDACHYWSELVPSIEHTLIVNDTYTSFGSSRFLLFEQNEIPFQIRLGYNEGAVY